MRLDPSHKLLVVALIAGAGCHLVSGVGSLRDEPADGGRGGNVLEGAGGGGAPNSSTGTAVGGALNGMGGGGSDCDFGVIGSCGMGQKCALFDEDAGPAGGTVCITPGSKPSYVPCLSSNECEDGLFCNRRWTVCQPICDVAGDCTSGGLCQAARGPSNMPVPGVKTCSANCIPDSGSPCKQTDGPVACVNTPDDLWECMPGNDIPKGNNCAAANDCEIGLGCFGSNPSVCRQWCTPASDTGVDASCPLAEACFIVLPNSVFHNGTEFGICI